MALEKAQVAVLAERVEELLDEVLRVSGGTAAVPAVAPVDAEDNDPLDAPIEEEFRVGAMSLAWDPDTGRVVVECFAEGVPVDEDEERRDRRRGARGGGPARQHHRCRRPGVRQARARRRRGGPAAVPLLQRPAGRRPVTSAPAPTATAVSEDD